MRGVVLVACLLLLCRLSKPQPSHRSRSRTEDVDLKGLLLRNFTLPVVLLLRNHTIPAAMHCPALQKILQKELDRAEQEKQGILKDYNHARDEAVKLQERVVYLEQQHHHASLQKLLQDADVQNESIFRRFRDENIDSQTIKDMSDSQLRARGLNRGNVLKLRSLTKDEEGKCERLNAHRFNSLQQHLRCVGVRDICILKRFKDENIDIPAIEHMSDNELMKDFGLKQKNVDRLRSRINHVVERKYDSESCYAGLKADFGEMMQAIIDIRHVFGSLRQCVRHKTDCKSSPKPSQSVEDMSDNEFLEDSGLLNRPRTEPICTEPICKDLSYQRLWWSQQNGYQEWQTSSSAIKHLNAQHLSDFIF